MQSFLTDALQAMKFAWKSVMSFLTFPLRVLILFIIAVLFLVALVLSGSVYVITFVLSWVGSLSAALSIWQLKLRPAPTKPSKVAL